MRITKADKVEVLRTITLAEYDGTEIVLTRNDEGGEINVFLPDPRVEEREIIRNFVNSLDLNIEGNEVTVRDLVVAELDRRDAENLETYGERKGQQRRRSFYTSFDREQAEVLENLFARDSVTYGAREAVRKAITSDTSSDW